MKYTVTVTYEPGDSRRQFVHVAGRSPDEEDVHEAWATWEASCLTAAWVLEWWLLRIGDRIGRPFRVDCSPVTDEQAAAPAATVPA